MNRTTLFFEADLSPIEGNAGKSDTDFKETEGAANLHHGLADLRGSFASLSEVGKNPGPQLSELEESRRRAGPIGVDRRCGRPKFFRTNRQPPTGIWSSMA